MFAALDRALSRSGERCISLSASAQARARSPSATRVRHEQLEYRHRIGASPFAAAHALYQPTDPGRGRTAHQLRRWNRTRVRAWKPTALRSVGQGESIPPIASRLNGRPSRTAVGDQPADIPAPSRTRDRRDQMLPPMPCPRPIPAHRSCTRPSPVPSPRGGRRYYRIVPRVGRRADRGCVVNRAISVTPFGHFRASTFRLLSGADPADSCVAAVAGDHAVGSVVAVVGVDRRPKPASPSRHSLHMFTRKLALTSARGVISRSSKLPHPARHR